MRFSQKIKTAFCLCALSFASAEAATPVESYDPTNDVLSFFGSRCGSTYGNVSSVALAQSGQLKSIITRILNDETCRGLADALDQLALATRPLLNSTQAELARKDLKSQVNALQLALATEIAKPNPDPTYVDALEAEFDNKQITLLEIGQSPSYEATRTRLDTLGSLTQYSSTVFAELSRSATCVGKHPGIVAEIGSQLLAISSNLESGVIGSLMLVAGSTFDHLLTYLRNYKIARVWKQTVYDSLLPAIECGLESMASVYCEARDVANLVEWNAQLHNASGAPKNAKAVSIPDDLRGIDIIGRDLAAYVQWVSRIKTGSPATGPANASEKQKAIQLEADLEIYGINMQGSIRQTEFKLQSQSGDQESLIKELISNLAGVVQQGIPFYGSNVSVSGTVTPGPFKRIFQEDPECGPYSYFVSEAKRNFCTRQNQTESCLACAIRMNDGKLPGSVQAVSVTTDQLLRQARQAVSIDTAPYKESNPALLLANATARGVNGSRPKDDFIESTLQYFQYLLDLPDYADPLSAERRLIMQGIDQASQALEVLNHPSDAPPPKLKKIIQLNGTPVSRQGPIDDLNELDRILVPSNDPFTLPNTLLEITHQHLDRKLERGEVNSNLALLIQLSSTDSLVSVLQNYVGLDNARNQSVVARTQAESNLRNFSELFKDHIDRTLTALMEKNPQAAHFKKLCIELTLVPDFPALKKLKKTYSKACAGAELSSVYPDLKLSFDTLIAQPFENRVCALYDFNRKSKALELRRHSALKSKKAR